MTITVEIPEELAGQLIAAGQDPARATLEAIALEDTGVTVSVRLRSLSCLASTHAWKSMPF